MKNKKVLSLLVGLGVLIMSISACAGQEGPQGPQGEQGVPGLNGSQGLPGKDGSNGRDGSDGKDGRDGSDGKDGRDGSDGKDGVSVVSITKTGSDGLIDTYTITYSNGTTSTFTVTNGATGDQGIQGNPGADGHTPVITISADGYWTVDGVKTSVLAQGPQGEQGPQGPAGPEGPQGQTGADGCSALTGNGEPSSALGKNGDSYIDLSTWNYYVKESGAWVLKGNIKGEQGPTGQTGSDGLSVFTGSGEPSSALGKNGDSYIDLSSWNYYVKESNSWVLKGNIKGDPGEDFVPEVCVHTWSNWFVVSTANCMQPEGLKQRYCTKCNVAEYTTYVSYDHHFSNHYCVYCGQHDTTYQNLTVRHVDGGPGQYHSFSGYYIDGFADHSILNDDPMDIYLPSTYYSEYYGYGPIIGICNSALADDDHPYLSIRRLDFPSTYKEIQSSGVRGVVENLVLNEGMEVLKDHAVMTITGDVNIPSTVRYIGEDALGGRPRFYSAVHHVKYYFEGDCPEYMHEYAMEGLVFYFNPQKNGWPSSDTSKLYGGIAIKMGHEPVVEFDDNLLNAQMELYAKGAKEYLETFYSNEKINNYNWKEWFTLTIDEDEKDFFLDLALDITADCSTQQDKITAVYNWVHTNIEYNFDATSNYQLMYKDIYTSVIEGKGVCAQYAGIMSQLLCSLNIPCMLVDGYLLQLSIPIYSSFLFDQTINGQDPHLWVVAHDGNEWSYYDPTNDYAFDLDTYHPGDVYFIPLSINDANFYTEGMNPYRHFIDQEIFYYEGQWYRTNCDYWMVPATYFETRVDKPYFWRRFLSQFTNNNISHSYFYSFDDETGLLQTGLIEYIDDSETLYCYVLETGMMISNCSIEVDGVTYTFDNTGWCHNI